MSDSERGLPAIAELANLPRLAIVAYAAACARRRYGLDVGPEALRERAWRAIEVAMRISLAAPHASGEDAYVAYRDAADAASAVTTAANDYSAGNTYRAASNAARAACCSGIFNTARHGVQAAVDAAGLYPGHDATEVTELEFPRSVFSRLSAMADDGNWDNRTPVPGSFYEWVEQQIELDVAPAKDPKAESQTGPQHGRASFTLSIPENMSDEDANALSVKLVRLLNAAYKEQGGAGLTIDDTRILSPCLEPVGGEA